LLDKGFEKNLISMQAIGYKEIIEFLEGNITFEEAVNILKRNTRHFAKRQFTWFLKDENVKWFNIEDVNKIDASLEQIYEYLNLI
ncbi:MAG: tRNA ((37)-N6)-dimethylallyltransferase MiaA, partial [Sedimentibacter sp.]|nr:tRNA ((37)-N6)-dimethylallyltransferase MiaA [Sedimentibacter sp.]